MTTVKNTFIEVEETGNDDLNVRQARFRTMPDMQKDEVISDHEMPLSDAKQLECCERPAVVSGPVLLGSDHKMAVKNTFVQFEEPDFEEGARRVRTCPALENNADGDSSDGSLVEEGAPRHVDARRDMDALLEIRMGDETPGVGFCRRNTEALRENWLAGDDFDAEVSHRESEDLTQGPAIRPCGDVGVVEPFCLQDSVAPEGCAARPQQSEAFSAETNAAPIACPFSPSVPGVASQRDADAAARARDSRYPAWLGPPPSPDTASRPPVASYPPGALTPFYPPWLCQDRADISATSVRPVLNLASATQTQSVGAKGRLPRLWCHIYLHMLVDGFDLVPMLIGRRGQNMRKIFDETGAKLRVRGKGSGHLEIDGQREAPTPLMVAVTADKGDHHGFKAAIEKVLVEIRSVEKRFRSWCQKTGHVHQGPCFSIGCMPPGGHHLLGDIIRDVPNAMGHEAPERAE